MSDSVESTEATESETVETPAQEETDFKAESRKWESRSKENKAALDAMTGERDEFATKIEELTAKNSEWETKFAALESERQLSQDAKEVAEAAGVPVDALRGSNREELEAHAETLKTILKSLPSAPVVDSQGKSPQKVAADPDIEAVRELFGNTK